MQKEVHELEKGELFVWDTHPHYLHQMTDERDGNGSPIGNHIGTVYNEGEDFTIHEPRPQNWNPYCTVRVVRINPAAHIRTHLDRFRSDAVRTVLNALADALDGNGTGLLELDNKYHAFEQNR